MSLAEIENKVLRLSEEERRQFASWFYEHEAEITGRATEGDDGISDGQKAELARRLEEIEERPEILVPFEEGDVVKMFEEFAHARDQKAPTRQG